jgi:hypothetical protein
MKPSPSPGDLATRIVDRETAEMSTPEALAGAIEGVFTKLEAFMATLIGPSGFRAVLDRAAHLSSAAWPWLESAKIETDLVTAIKREGAPAVKAGSAALLENAIRLSCNFIGEDLTLRLVFRAWPYLLDVPEPSRSEESDS